MTKRRRSRTPRSRALEIAVAAIPAATLIGFGGTAPESLALATGLLALALIRAGTLPARQLEHRGGIVLFGLLSALLCAVLGVAGVVHGTLWATLHLGTLVTAPLAMAMVAASWVSRGWENRLERILAVGSAFVIVMAVVATGPTETYLGVVPVPAGTTLNGPFVDANHVGAVLLLAFPVWLFRAVKGPNRWVHVLMVATAVATALVVGSTGPVVIMGLQAVLIAVMLRKWLLVLPGVVLLPVVFLLGLETGVDTTLHDRTYVWRLSASMWADNPFFGTGPSTFANAIEPYRTDMEFHVWNHAHNDFVEWLVELGLLGTLVIPGCLLLAWLCRPRGRFEAALYIGVGGVLLFAGLDFPLHVPILGITAGLMLGSMTQGRFATLPGKRLVLLASAALMMVVTAAQLREAGVKRATASLHTPSAPRAASLLSWLAPHEPELALYEARSLPTEAAWSRLEQALSRHPDNARLLRTQARLSARLPDRVRDVTDALIAAHPADYRSWVERAEAIGRVYPEERRMVWADVLSRAECPLEARCPRRAYDAFPEPLYWMEVLLEHPDALLSMAAQFRDDADAVVLADEALRFAGRPGLGIPAADAWLTLGEPGQAEWILRQLTGRRAQVKLGRLLQRQGRHGEAAEVFAPFESDPQLRLHYWEALGASGRRSEVLGDIDRLTLSGTLLNRKEALLRARLHAENGDVGQCEKTMNRAPLNNRSAPMRRCRDWRDAVVPEDQR